MSKLMLADWDTDWRVLSSGFRRCPNRGVSEACFMELYARKGSGRLKGIPMKQRKWLSRMAATAAAMATLLTGGVVAGTALAADTDEPGLTASKTVTATDKPNVFDVNLSATGRDYAKNREHALFVLDRTGSVGQAEYDEIANAVRSWAGV